MPEIESFADAVNQAATALNVDEGRATAQQPPATETKAEQAAPEAKTSTEPVKEVVKSGEKQPEATKEVVKSDEKQTASKLMGKKADKAQTAPQEGEVLDWKTAPAKLRKAFEHRTQEYETLKSDAEKIRSELAALKAKPVETKQDTKLIEQLQGELKEYRQRIAELDYSKSDEFKEKYVTRFNKAYEQAINEVTQLQVNTGDDNSPTRPANQSDFDALRSLPFGQRRATARRLFGEDADVALQHVARLDSIRQEATEAIENQKANFEKIQSEKKLTQERESAEFNRLVDVGRQEIYEAFKDVFGVEETDAESKSALEGGRGFVDAYLNKLSGMDASSRAQHQAVAIAQMESWPLLYQKLGKALERATELEAELTKLRSSDPGAAKSGKQVESKKVEEEVGGFSDIEKMFNTLPKD